MNEYMTYYGRPITTRTSKKELLEIIHVLAESLEQERKKSSEYLEAVDPIKLLMNKKPGSSK